MCFSIEFPPGSVPVTDVDEEIFLLYTALNQGGTELTGPDGHRGLGFIDSRQDTLSIKFELAAPIRHESSTGTSENKRSFQPRKARQQKKEINLTKVIEIGIFQDKTALRSRKGDTGSVVWRASVEFARAVLQQCYFPSDSSVFSRSRLGECHCLELGSGTGLLGIALSPLFRTYTVTDIAPLLPLVQKNIVLNVGREGAQPASKGTNLSVEELDWATLSSLPPGRLRKRYCPIPSVDTNSTSGTDGIWDVVLLVDCIYHPSLLPPLVETIEAVSTPQRTWVFVVVELRQEDVVREFLNLWLSSGARNWNVTRIEGILDTNYAVWAGCKG